MLELIANTARDVSFVAHGLGFIFTVAIGFGVVAGIVLGIVLSIREPRSCKATPLPEPEPEPAPRTVIVKHEHHGAEVIPFRPRGEYGVRRRRPDCNGNGSHAA